MTLTTTRFHRVRVFTDVELQGSIVFQGFLTKMRSLASLTGTRWKALNEGAAEFQIPVGRLHAFTQFVETFFGFHTETQDN